MPGSTQRRQTVESLAETAARHDEQIEGLISAVRNLAAAQETGFAELRKDISSIVKPQWQTWIGAGGLLLGVTTLLIATVSSVGGVVMAGISGDQTRVEADLDRLHRDYEKHTRNGHPESVVGMVKENTERIGKLDEVLQREMRLINETTRAELQALDNRLQQEIRTMNRFGDENSSLNRRRIEKLEERLFNGAKP